MSDFLARTEMILGKENIDKLKIAHVAIFGIGGVGGYVAEALARSGVGSFTLFDADVVSKSNINRQIIATNDTIGMPKTEAMKNRILSINPCANVTIHSVFYLPENADMFPLDKYSYVVDAIDTVSAKIELVVRCKAMDIPIISSMGTGNKLNPTDLTIADIYETSYCPLARVMRRELSSRDIKSLKVVYSKEKPLKPLFQEESITNTKKPTPGSTAFVPSVAGLIIASEVVKDLCGI